MLQVKIASEKGTTAIRKLREQKLKKGLPFMINAKELAPNQCYLEFPNGSIQLVAVVHATTGMNVIKELSITEATKLRKRFHILAQ